MRPQPDLVFPALQTLRPPESNASALNIKVGKVCTNASAPAEQIARRVGDQRTRSAHVSTSLGKLDQ
ncbi:MAG: hypothetical protein LC737_11360 [Chloroflexi bacterium]|nr:hypothetical protein [Chloroflexota bacterium]